MSWLNAEAESNVRYILVTDDVSHAEISALNVLLPPKPLLYPLISVTRLTSQSGMVPKFVVDKPYVVHRPVSGDSAKQLAIAVKNWPSVRYVPSVHELAGPLTASVHVNFA
ncbi:unnamed protein product [Bathycoccus prasinos]